MGYGIKLKVWGQYALFSRPELKVERVSYDVMTPSAARGILEAIHWKPAIVWIIDKIHVINEIKFENIRRNEVKSKIPIGNVTKAMKGDNSVFYLDVEEDRQQRASMVLKDVCYIIDAHFELTEKAGVDDTEEKHYNIATRRMKQGQCFNTPYFGCREFGVNFELIEDEELLPNSYYKEQNIDLGFVLYDIDFQNNKNPMFFRAKMEKGIIDCGKIEVKR
ncbi:MAG: type I-C CRISPR-associated protein Cas5c [Candidatus Gastranaerophilales bacterium]|nr:type I-C CRISPR-associated protein Cas5c [Candidatus Gastranaerophilales bacterium]